MNWLQYAKRKGAHLKIRVYYEDVDIGGIVYHSKYLNFCERARSELFFAQGMKPVMDGYHFVVRHIDASFLKPAYFGDILEVQTKFMQQKGARIWLEQTILKSEETIFAMVVELVCMKQSRPAKIPPAFVHLLQEIQNDRQKS